MGNDPNGIKGFLALGPVVGPEIDRMLGEFCFGDVWARDGLDLRTRRIVMLTTVATLSRPKYLRTHIRAAVEQGFERREILEIFMQMIAYAGFPTALSAMDCAGEVFADLDAAAAARLKPTRIPPWRFSEPQGSAPHHRSASSRHPSV